MYVVVITGSRIPGVSTTGSLQFDGVRRDPCGTPLKDESLIEIVRERGCFLLLRLMNVLLKNANIRFLH